MAIKDRRAKAREAQAGIEVLHKDGKGRPDVMAVPGSEHRTYIVKIKRGHWVAVECKLHGLHDCRGNGPRDNYPHVETICYHGRSGVDEAMRQAGYRGSWCESEADALQLMRLKKQPMLIPVRSAQNRNGIEYMVVERL